MSYFGSVIPTHLIVHIHYTVFRNVVCNSYHFIQTKPFNVDLFSQNNSGIRCYLTNVDVLTYRTITVNKAF